MIIVADQDEGGSFDVLQSMAGVVFLSRDGSKIPQDRGSLFEPADIFRRGPCVAEHKPPSNRPRWYAPDIFLVTHLDHLFGDSEWNPRLSRVRCAAGGEDQLAGIPRVLERQELRDPAPHGMTADHRALKAEIIEHGGCIGREHVPAVFRGRLAGQAGAAISRWEIADRNWFNVVLWRGNRRSF